jgi:recombination protein RecR
MSRYQLPKQVGELAAALGALPGIGPKMANRLSVYLATKYSHESTRLAQALQDLSQNIGTCPKTGNITNHGEVDSLYLDPSRDRTKLLVVESSLDLIQIETSQAYTGLYLVLGGLIAPLSGVGPDDLNLNLISQLLDGEPITEIIFGLSSTVEGEATAMYVSNLVRKSHPEIGFSRLARGLPSGASIEYLDFDTIKSALSRRTEVE